MDEHYRWDDGTYATLAAAGVAWPDVDYVLHHGHPRVRRHAEGLLHIAAAAPDGRLIGVTLIEETDDQYLVVAAHHLDGDARDAVAKMLGGTHEP